jgi:hypothetical protein
MRLAARQENIDSVLRNSTRVKQYGFTYAE